jgi:LPS export ABC transporter protein LptC
VGVDAPALAAPEHRRGLRELPVDRKVSTITMHILRLTKCLSILLATALCIYCGCSQKKEHVPVSSESVNSPYQELDTASMLFFTGTHKSWQLDANHILKSLTDTGHILGNPIRITVFDSLEKPSSKILADTGSCDAKMETFTVWSNVFVQAENGVRVRAQRLDWSQKTHRVTSQSYVEITTQKGDVMRGKGVDAAEDFSSWQFFHDVSGRFPNFKERIDKGDVFTP